MKDYDQMSPEELNELPLDERKQLSLDNKRRLPGYKDTKSENYFGSLNMKPLGKDKARDLEVQKAGAKATQDMWERKHEMDEFIERAHKVLNEHDSLDSLQVMRVIMAKHLQDGDIEAAHSVAKDIAKYEHPSLSSVDSTVREVQLSDLSDEELADAIAEMDNVVPFSDEK